MKLFNTQGLTRKCTTSRWPGPCEPFVLKDGYPPVPRGPGLEVTPVPGLLAEVATSTVWLGS